MTSTDPSALAQELMAAYAGRQEITVPPSARDQGFDLATAYAVESELVRLRRAAGRTTVGRKVGFANKAMWRVLKLDTLVWAHMYDDTVQLRGERRRDAVCRAMYSPKIEPEIVFRLKRPLEPGDLEPAAVLDAVEWLALGFEIIDCVFPDWKFQPADFVASFGLHAALVVGEPRAVEPGYPGAGRQLPGSTAADQRTASWWRKEPGRTRFAVRRSVSGSSPPAIARQPGAEPLAAGELISTGTLTNSHPIAPGETWRGSRRNRLARSEHQLSGRSS